MRIYENFPTFHDWKVSKSHNEIFDLGDEICQQKFQNGGKQNRVSTVKYLKPLVFRAPSIKCAFVWPFLLNNSIQI